MCRRPFSVWIFVALTIYNSNLVKYKKLMIPVQVIRLFRWLVVDVDLGLEDILGMLLRNITRWNALMMLGRVAATCGMDLWGIVERDGTFLRWGLERLCADVYDGLGGFVLLLGLRRLRYGIDHKLKLLFFLLQLTFLPLIMPLRLSLPLNPIQLPYKCQLYSFPDIFPFNRWQITKGWLPGRWWYNNMFRKLRTW